MTEIATRMKNIRVMFASVNSIGPIGAKALASNVLRLVCLRIACNPLKEEGVCALAFLTDLKILDVGMGLS